MEPSPESKQNAAPSLPSLIELYRNVVQKRHGQIVSELYWSRHKVSVDPGHSKKLRREKALIRRLLKAGIKGWAEKKTFYQYQATAQFLSGIQKNAKSLTRT